MIKKKIYIEKRNFETERPQAVLHSFTKSGIALRPSVTATKNNPTLPSNFLQENAQTPSLTLSSMAFCPSKKFHADPLYLEEKNRFHD
ncbi:hypothetical protein CDAR_484571 [Caerostris darwini]|uniref:Uncharacterized protein n=1 Tax=Caerostris darwini TaxID=1538125 RepID=A0AAV4MLI3_9ARAC|nr:hypothetical protein CDAR_484571 [Caerostris darwini]